MVVDILRTQISVVVSRVVKSVKMNVKRSVKSISVMQSSASVLHHAHFTGTLGHCEELEARSQEPAPVAGSGEARCPGPHHVSHADLSSIRLVLDNWS